MVKLWCCEYLMSELNRPVCSISAGFLRGVAKGSSFSCKGVGGLVKYQFCSAGCLDADDSVLTLVSFIRGTAGGICSKSRSWYPVGWEFDIFGSVIAC